MSKRLTIRTQLDVHSGYGAIGVNLFYELQKLGIFVSLRASGVDTQHGTSIPKEMLAQMVQTRQPEQFELFIYCPTLPLTPDRSTIQYTMWESTTISQMSVSLLSRCDAIVVPCNWCKVSFKKSGAKRPIYVVPLGFDPTVYKPAFVNESGPTIFGVAGRVAHCPKRKMIQEAIDLFTATFRGVPDVRLHVKVHPDDKLNVPNDKRVKIFRDVMEPYQLANWLHGLTAFVTLARSEGFGLWPLQALACGRPVIGCKYSGQADFMTAENSFLIAHKEIPVDGAGDSNVQYDGLWADPNLKNAASVMQAIHRNRTAVIEKAAVAPESVKRLTWAHCASKLVKVLESRGAFRILK